MSHSEKGKKLKKRTIALITLAAFLGVLVLTFGGFYLAFLMTDANAHTWTPDYDPLSPEELKAIYDKEDLTEDDYKILFEQTGLTEVGIARAKSRSNGWQRVLKIQEEYFAERTVDKQFYAPLVCNDRTDRAAKEIYLERGDIIISSSTHFAGFRVGHTAIVTNEGIGRDIFEATQVGFASQYNSIESITDRINFMILRIKPEFFGGDDGSYKSNLDHVTTFIADDLKDAPYSIFTGVFTDKQKINYTMCSHLIWYAFKYCAEVKGEINYSIDLDPNGGNLVMPSDIFKSPYVELVQTFGFDPDKGYS